MIEKYSSNNFICDICNQTLARKHNLIEHKKTVHNRKKDFKCDTCDDRFTQKSNLLKKTHYHCS